MVLCLRCSICWASCCLDKVEGTRLSSDQGMGTGVGASCCQMRRAWGLKWESGRLAFVCLLKEFASQTNHNKMYFLLNCHSLRFQKIRFVSTYKKGMGCGPSGSYRFSFFRLLNLSRLKRKYRTQDAIFSFIYDAVISEYMLAAQQLVIIHSILILLQ